jgi:2-dehydro-3-deoxyglucarate aldolase/4-hydroxy-2-oxoheptanedioate aldolase
MIDRNHTNIKESLKKGKKQFAAWAQAASNITAEILADAGFDIIVVDLEHGPGSIMDLIGQIQAMQGHRAIPFARSPWNDFVQIKRILDAGVYGLLVPYVNTRQEAEAAVKAILYPCGGIRGVAGSPRAAHYGNNSMEYHKNAGEEIILFTAVETPEAVKNLDEILTVERLDGIFVGPVDLATSMGYLGNPSHTEVQDAIRTIESKVLAAGKFLATIGGSWDDVQTKFSRGYSIIVGMSDTVNLGQVAREKVARFQEHFGKE